MIFARYGTAPVVTLGLLALVVQLMQRAETQSRPSRIVGRVGRMALSCYVLQNLMASALCYGWGLGLAARMASDVRVPGTVAIYSGFAVMVTVFAHLWLMRFSRGPVELAWVAAYDSITSGLPIPRTSASEVREQSVSRE